MIESRSATPEPAGEPRNDTGVITHALAAPVKRWNRNSYHSVTCFRRVALWRVYHPPHRPPLDGVGPPSLVRCEGHGSGRRCRRCTVPARCPTSIGLGAVQHSRYQ
ncbi:hypothetical protein CYL16_13115 [Mycobacterium sp. EPG1]|nr:hypothetical protein CYL16_13115 [Mycobacterium sp. EPG1]